MVKERTRELNAVNTQLEETKEEVVMQNEELRQHRNDLENLVYERTHKLQLALQKAEEADRLKSSFLANMSHEIRDSHECYRRFCIGCWKVKTWTRK